LLRALAAAGFENLVGVDAYLPKDVEFGSRLRILATSISHFSSENLFDLIMFHHSLEHMPEHEAILGRVVSLLKPGGTCLVRIPIAGSELWRDYYTDWVGLDAPRHLLLHTPESLKILARRCGLDIYMTRYDSSAFNYYASEFYRRGLTLHDDERRRMRDPASVFSPAEMAAFVDRAERANADRRADQAAFYLCRTQRA